MKKNLTKCLKSIFSQTKKPGQIIVCLPENIDLKYQFKEIQIIKSKFRNQVYQRSIALKLLKKNIKILVQLDSSCELYKNTFNKLILTWSNQSADVAGIGMIPTNYLLPKVNIFQEFFLTNSKNIGKVLKSGYVSAWDRKVKNKNVEWLNGGCVSWRLDLCKDIFKRKYPKIFWSVAEDLIYSFNKSKKFKLMVSNSLKVKYNKVIEPSKLDINNCFKKGFFSF